MANVSPAFRLLGQIEVEGVDTARLGGPKQRAVLAYLLLHSGEVVTTAQLVDDVWGDDAPPTASAIVHGYIRRLRQTIAATDAAIRTRSSGYTLEISVSDLDVHRFELLTGEGFEALHNGRPDDARRSFAEALALWRGEPLAGLAGAFVYAPRSDLEKRKLTAALVLCEANLQLGRAREAVPELEALALQHPFDESISRMLMLALYRSANQGAALAVYQDVRRRLAEDLGLEPTQALQQLETAILRQDPSLDLDVPHHVAGNRTQRVGKQPPDPERRTARILAWCGMAAAVVAVGALVLVQHGAYPLHLASSASPSTAISRVPPAPSSSSAALLSHPADIIAAWAIPQPSCCGVSDESAWGVGHHDDTLREIDLATNTMTDLGVVADFQSGVPHLLAGSVWVPSAAGSLVRYDPVSHRVTARIAVSGSDVAFGFLSLWETTRNHRLVRISLASNAVVASIQVAPGANDWDDGLAIGGDAVWDSVGDSGQLLKIDPATNRVMDRISGFGDTDSGAPIAFDRGAVWLLRAVAGQMTLFRVDAARDRIVAAIPVGAAGGGNTGTVAAGGGYIWTATWDGIISRVDPVTNRVTEVLSLPAVPQNIAFGHGSVWADSYDAGQVWRIEPFK